MIYVRLAVVRERIYSTGTSGTYLITRPTYISASFYVPMNITNAYKYPKRLQRSWKIIMMAAIKKILMITYNKTTVLLAADWPRSANGKKSHN